jgi:hypothetical protein
VGSTDLTSQEVRSVEPTKEDRVEYQEEAGPVEVWHVGDEATKRLAELGLSEEDLRNPLDLARADAQLCTELDAPTAPGFMFWTRANRYLREQLIQSGWQWTNRDSILRAIAPGGRFAITALSGSGDVGIEGGKVRTRNEKGSAMAVLVRYNYFVLGGPQNNDALPDLEMVLPVFESDMMPTWVLLYKWTREGIMLELALPSDMFGRFVNRWREHIIVTHIGFEGGGNVPIDYDVFNTPDGSGVDVPVERIA